MNAVDVKAGAEATGDELPLTCGICNGAAETVHLNYGAQSCFSCRAFFRRIIQKNTVAKLKCKGAGNCVLDPNSSAKCKKCRFENCIRQGMQPSMVLQGPEKIAHFRKLITKQLEDDGQEIKRVEAGPKKRGRKKKPMVTDLPEEVVANIKLSFKRKSEIPHATANARVAERVKVNEQWPSSSATPASTSGLCTPHSTGSSGRASPVSSSALSSSPTEDEDMLMPSPCAIKVDSPLMSFIARHALLEDDDTSPLNLDLDYHVCLPECLGDPCVCSCFLWRNGALMNLDGEVLPPLVSQSKSLEETKWRLRQIQKTWLLACLATTFDSTSVQNILLFHHGHREALTISTIQNHMRHLALLFHNFASKQPEFIALSNREQASLLTETTPLFVHYILSRYLSAESGHEQLSWLLVNGASSDVKTYEVQYASRSPLSSLQERVPLFQTEGALQRYSTLLQAVNEYHLPYWSLPIVGLLILFRTKRSMIDYPLIVKTLENTSRSASPSLPLLLLSLEEMSKMICHQSDVMRHDHKELIKSISVEYTDAEEAWLRSTFLSYHETIDSVNMGPEMVKEFLMFSLDVPFSKNHLKMMGGVLQERMMRVYTNSQAFHSLHFLEQEAMMKSNIQLCVTLHLARCCCSNGRAQVEGMCGKEDSVLFQEGKKILHNRPIRQITLPDVSPHMTKEQMEHFKERACGLAKYVRHGDTFDVLMHCLLFSSERVQKNARIQALENRFQLALQRRLKKAFGCAQPAVMEGLYSTVADVKELAELTEKYLFAE